MHTTLNVHPKMWTWHSSRKYWHEKLTGCVQCPARVDIGSSRSEKWNENLVHSFREVKSEIKIWFTYFENEKWNENASSSRSRMKSEMEIPQNRDREWKVKWKCLEIEIEKWNFSRILEKFLRIKKSRKFTKLLLQNTTKSYSWTNIFHDKMQSYMHNFTLFSREKEWNLKCFHSFREMKSEIIFPFTHSENEKWNENALRSRSRMKSEMKMPRDRDWEVKCQQNSREFSRNETLAGYWGPEDLLRGHCQAGP